MLTKKVNGIEVALSHDEINDYEDRKTKHESGLLDAAKKTKCQEVNALRDKGIKKPYKWPEPIDGKEREFNVNLLDELNAAMVLDDTETQPWICEDNEYPGVTLTKQQMKQICKHMRVRKTTLIHEGRRIKNEILGLNTIEEVENYQIEL